MTNSLSAQGLREWKDIVKRYERPDPKAALWQLANSVIPYLCLWWLAAHSMSDSTWIAIPLAMMASGFFVRTFIIFHDCGHYSFLRNRRANEVIGVMTGFLTFFPYYKWRYEHAVHHATSGNLDNRGVGDIWILTVNEYRDLPPFRRLLYRLYRNPVVLFGFGPIYLLVNARLNRKNAGRRERWNTYITNAALVAAIAVLCALLGWKTVLVVQGLILYCSGIVGTWLFYVQHQFEGSYFEECSGWSYFDAALRGSSFYKLPGVLQWITGNIGFHHVHHLGPRIPNYNLQRAHQEVAAFQSIQPITLRRSLSSLRYRLWDENQKTFVGFREL